jgi:transporter family protein
MSWFWYAILAVVSGGVYAIVAKKALGLMSWQQFMFWDMVVYVVLITVVFLWSREKVAFGLPMVLAIVCCLIGFVGMVATSVAIQRGRVSVVTPVIAVYPAVTLALAVLLLHEPVTMRKVSGLIMAVVAVVLLGGGS